MVLRVLTERLSQHFQRWMTQNHFVLQPALLGSQPATLGSSLTGSSALEHLQDAFWFAVPKQKVSRSKKRMKTTVHKRIKLKENIISDPRTGEVTLMHKLPFNWEEYLPEIAKKPVKP
mmetsp:Transcript_15579/g.20295  ORF Transcript_15579/g.20295 Transcript_15579/m.20295 type:complete len:118 (-) Transcript_15579:50-403(-)